MMLEQSIKRRNDIANTESTQKCNTKRIRYSENYKSLYEKTMELAFIMEINRF